MSCSVAWNCAHGHWCMLFCYSNGPETKTYVTRTVEKQTNTHTHSVSHTHVLRKMPWTSVSVYCIASIKAYLRLSPITHRLALAFTEYMFNPNKIELRSLWTNYYPIRNVCVCVCDRNHVSHSIEKCSVNDSSNYY